jgi:hypothetical protein
LNVKKSFQVASTCTDPERKKFLQYNFQKVPTLEQWKKGEAGQGVIFSAEGFTLPKGLLKCADGYDEVDSGVKALKCKQPGLPWRPSGCKKGGMIHEPRLCS